MNILLFIPIVIASFLPILLWGYIFSYLDNSPLSSRRFVLGILAGWASVIPIISLEQLFQFIGARSYNIFTSLVQEGSDSVFISLSIATLLIGSFSFIASFGFFFEEILKSYKTLLRNIWLILVFGGAYTIFRSVISEMNILTLSVNGVTAGGVTFGTVKLVLFYYLMIALIEEASKHFSVAASSTSSIDSVRKWVLISIFVALGFGCIENILYLYNLSLHSGFFSVGTISTWIFRSIISLFVHIICSAVVGYYFARALLLPPMKHRWIAYIKLFSTGFLISVVLHAIFDISLTLWFTGIIFIYLFFGYLGITRIFYRE